MNPILTTGLKALIVSAGVSVGFAVVMLIVCLLLKKYLKPYVHANAERVAGFQEFALIVDRITNDVVTELPGATWAKMVDEAVDRIIKALGLKDADDIDKAQRETKTQLISKGIFIMTENGPMKNPKFSGLSVPIMETSGIAAKPN